MTQSLKTVLATGTALLAIGVIGAMAGCTKPADTTGPAPGSAPVDNTPNPNDSPIVAAHKAEAARKAAGAH